MVNLKRFFEWLAGQPGFKSRINYSDAEYFNLSEKDVRVATARRQSVCPTLQQARHVLDRMPTLSPVDRRNRALVAFTILTGCRVGATASLKMKHLDIASGSVFLDARDVRTKFSKSFIVNFFDIGDDVRAMFEDWIRELRSDHSFDDDDPVFPATATRVGPDSAFMAAGLSRQHWLSSSPIRAVFRSAFGAAGLPYFHPHTFRRTLVVLGEDLCQTPEEFKAWSQNLGHEQVLTTFTSYSAVSAKRQAEILSTLRTKHAGSQSSVEEIAKAVARELRSRSTALEPALSIK